MIQTGQIGKFLHKVGAGVKLLRATVQLCLPDVSKSRKVMVSFQRDTKTYWVNLKHIWYKVAHVKLKQSIKLNSFTR